MSTITTRIGKGDPLSFTEMDSNLTNLNTDKLENINSESIGDLSNVDITTSAPTDGQALVWDNANSKFIPGDAGSDLSTSSVNALSDVDTTSVTAGDLLMWDGTNNKFIVSSAYSNPVTTNSGNVTSIDGTRNPNTITLDSYGSITQGDQITFQGTQVTSAGLSTSQTYNIHASVGSGEFELNIDGTNTISITNPGSITDLQFTHSPQAPTGLLLNSLGDVSSSSPSNGQFLKYDGSSWGASTLDLSSSSLGDLSDVQNAMTPSGGDVLQYDSTNNEWQSATPSGGSLGFGVMNIYGNANTISGSNNFYVSDGYGWTYNDDSLFTIDGSDYYFTFASTGYYWFDQVGRYSDNSDAIPNLDIRVSTDSGSSYSATGLQYQFMADEMGTTGDSVISFYGWIQVTDTSHRYIFGKSSTFSGLSFPIKWLKIKD